jgi:hypothetical protein
MLNCFGGTFAIRRRNENHLWNGFFGACGAGQPSCGSPGALPGRYLGSCPGLGQDARRGAMA